MVSCEHCGRTDGCSYQEFQGVTLCFRCYRAARDRAFEGQYKSAADAEIAVAREAWSRKTEIRRLAERLFRRE
ncbi:hypothetical protein RCIA120 [Methanocella arvoryzae MRE50]|uniref:Uncharacterized protein n=1 Tax=Methanocella arvoryzae (strain DSM 22066 / NBRC 105507 / MRE50) TaxID=351160 RepID=Q0W4C8_METAR|nr:hypothetical protein RCIA120 [Methanocella arvoryzae MRE50]